MNDSVVARLCVISAPNCREALLSEDVECQSFIERMFDCHVFFPTAILFWGEAGMSFGIAHHVPTKKLVILVEVGFIEKDGAELGYTEVVLLFFEHDICAGFPTSGG